MRNLKPANYHPLLLALCCLMYACGLSSDSIPPPDPADVAVILVSEGLGKLEPKATLQDRTVVSRALTLVSENRRWHQPLDTFPTPRATALFQDGKGRTTLVLWFGPDWIGARAAAPESKNLLWDAGPGVREEMKRLLNIAIMGAEKN